MYIFCAACNTAIQDPNSPSCAACDAVRPVFGWPRDVLIGKPVEDGLVVEERLGSGGFGVVYKARVQDTGEARAIKVLSEQHGNSPEAQKLFLQEARALIKLDHENIVRCVSFGMLEQRRPWIALEFVDGRSLFELVQKNRGAIEPRRAVRIAQQIAAALEAAHENHLLHRDLQPGNIMLFDSPSGEVVKVIDFGIAKVLGSNTVDRKTNRIIGTPEYMAPEQFQPGVALDARLDLWQLGAVLFFMLTGGPPHKVKAPEDLLGLYKVWDRQRAKHLPGELPSSVVPQIGAFEDLDMLVGRLLSADRSVRPSNASEVLSELRSIEALIPQNAARGAVSAAEHATTANLMTQEQDLRTAVLHQETETVGMCPHCGAATISGNKATCPACHGLRPLAGWPPDPWAGWSTPERRFPLMWRVASGRIGPLYASRDPRDGQNLVVRVIHIPRARKPLEALFREQMQGLLHISHPNLVAPLEVGSFHDGASFVAMKQVEGVSLFREVWPESWRYPRFQDPLKVVLHGIQLASALAHLHNQGWVHGGVTPRNTLLTRSRQTGTQMVLTGLGNAHIRRAALAVGVSIPADDPRFCAWEQLQRKTLGTPQSDIYQLGALLFFMLTGWPPHNTQPRDPNQSAEADEVLAVMAQEGGKKGPVPSRWIPALKAFQGLDELVASLLAVRPEDRPQNALQVALKLGEIRAAMQG